MTRLLPDAGSRRRSAVTAAVAVAFALNLALYRPLVRHWIDPDDARRQTVVALTPQGRTIVPVRPLVLGLAL